MLFHEYCKYVYKNHCNHYYCYNNSYYLLWAIGSLCIQELDIEATIAISIALATLALTTNRGWLNELLCGNKEQKKKECYHQQDLPKNPVFFFEFLSTPKFNSFNLEHNVWLHHSLKHLGTPKSSGWSENCRYEKLAVTRCVQNPQHHAIESWLIEIPRLLLSPIYCILAGIILLYWLVGWYNPLIPNDYWVVSPHGS